MLNDAEKAQMAQIGLIGSAYGLNQAKGGPNTGQGPVRGQNNQNNDIMKRP